MLLFIVLVAVAVGLPFLGATIALSSLSYTIENAVAVPGMLSLLILGAPLAHLAWHGLHVRFSFHWLDGAFLAFVIGRVASALYAPELGQKGLIDLAIFAASSVGYYAVGRLLFSGTIDPDRFARFFLAWLLLLVPIYLLSDSLQQVNDRLILGDGAAVGLSLPLTVGGACVVGWLIAQVDSSRSWRSASIAVAIMLFGGFLAWAIAQNGSRGSIVAVAVPATIGLCRFACRSRLRAAVSASLALVAILIGVERGLPDIGQVADVSNRFGRMLSVATGRFAFDMSLSERATIRAVALEQIEEHPAFGCGYRCVTTAAGNYAHNVELEIAAESGLFALLPFLVIVGAASLHACRLLWRSRSHGEVVLSAIMLSVLAHFQLSFTLTDGRILFFALGALTALAVSRPLREMIINKQHRREQAGIREGVAHVVPGAAIPTS